jgi:hypothetical protein
VKSPVISYGTASSLSRAELEAHDPGTWHAGENRRKCPLPACTDHQRKRNISANGTTGKWKCHACEAKGLLLEYRTDTPPAPRRPLRLVPSKPPVAAKPPIVQKQNVGPVRRWAGQDATGTIQGRQCRQDVRLTRADGTQEPSKEPWWELPDGRPSKGQIHAADLVYVAGGARLPEIPDGTNVLLVEGPVTADAGDRLAPDGWYVVGLLGGASSTPSPALLDQFARWHCTLSPDHDAHDKSQAMMRRIAGALLERWASPHWLELPVTGDGDDLVDYEREGGTPADLAARLATTPAAYHVLVSTLQAEWASEHAPLAGHLAEAEARRAQAVRDLRAYQNSASNKAVRAEVLTAAAVTSEVLSAASRGGDASAPIKIYLPELAKRVGVSDKQVGKHLDRLKAWGFIHKETETTVGPAADGHLQRATRVAVAIPALANGGSLADILEPLAAFEPPEVASGERLLQGQHRRCPDHPHPAIMPRYPDIGADCALVVAVGAPMAPAATAISDRATPPDTDWTEVTSVQNVAAGLPPVSLRDTYLGRKLLPSNLLDTDDDDLPELGGVYRLTDDDLDEAPDPWAEVTTAQPAPPNPALDPAPTLPPPEALSPPRPAIVADACAVCGHLLLSYESQRTGHCGRCGRAAEMGLPGMTAMAGGAE